MAYQTIADFNTSAGIHRLVQYANFVTGGLFMRLTLFAFFIIIAMGNFFSRKAEGKEDAAVSAAVASYATFVLALVLSLIPGLVDPTTLVIILGASVIFTLWMFFGKEK